MDTPAVVGASAGTLKMMDGCFRGIKVRKGSGGSSGPRAAAAMVHEQDWRVLEWSQSSPLAQWSVNGIPIVCIYENCAHDIPRLRRSHACFCSLASVTSWCPPNRATTRVVEDKNIVISTFPYMLEGFECVHALAAMCMDAHVFILTPQKDAGSASPRSFSSGLVITIEDRLMNPLFQWSGGRLLRMMLHSWWGQFNSRLTLKHWLVGLT